MSAIQSTQGTQYPITQSAENPSDTPNTLGVTPRSLQLDTEALGFTARELEPIFVADEPFAPEIQPTDVALEGQHADLTPEGMEEAAEQEPKRSEGGRSAAPGTMAGEPAPRATVNDFWDQVADLAHTYSVQKRGDAVPLAIATAATRLSAEATQKKPASQTAQQTRPASDVSTWTTGAQIAAENQTTNTGESALHARYDRAKQAEKISKYLEAQAKDAANVAFGTRGSAVRAASRARG